MHPARTGGAVLNGQMRTGGLCTVKEAVHHINYLELLGYSSLWEGLEKCHNFTANGQCHGIELHQPERRRVLSYSANWPYQYEPGAMSKRSAFLQNIHPQIPQLIIGYLFISVWQSVMHLMDTHCTYARFIVLFFIIQA